MDSSRSGLLSTLMMTLPLIVVPAIALLRPPGHAAGVSSTELDASESLEDDDFLRDSLKELSSDFAEADPETKNSAGSRKPDDVDSLFAEEMEESESSEPARAAASRRTKSLDEDSDPFMSESNPEDAGSTGDSSSDAAEDETLSAEKIVEHLNAQGALRTMWFEAGANSPVGLAVFFRGQTELMRIRFESVGQTRDECARNVLSQVTQWQAEQDALRGN
jgi:hypothetical protein